MAVGAQPEPAAETVVTPLPEGEPSLLSPGADWSDSRALAVVKKDFARMEAWRSNNHDRRFVASDRIYVAYREKKVWEGTRVPRASTSIFMALSQIESLLPSFIDGLFADPNFFKANPLANTTPEQARIVTMLLRGQLRDIGQPGRHMSLRNVALRQKKSDLIYGVGPVEFGWLMREESDSRYQRVLVPKRILLPNPLDPTQMAPVSTGQFDVQVRKIDGKRIVSRPLLQNVDARDFYIDQHCPSPNVQDAAACATRSWFSIAELQAMRDDRIYLDMGFTIPDDAKLWELSRHKTSTRGDTDRQQSESYRGHSYSPTIDSSSDPNLARVECIRYWQPTHHVWLLGREHVAYNRPNEYGMLPFLNSCYIEVLGRFYSLSLCDLVEGDQQLAQDILNARLDELALSVHAPIVRRIGARTQSSMRRIKPGVEWEVDGDPSKDIVRMEMGQVNPQAFLEVNALELRVQRATGITDLSSMGVPSSGGNSANRTATGVSTQRAASSARVKFQVANYEDQVLVPWLDIQLALNKRYLDPMRAVELMGPEGNTLRLDPLAVLNASVEFEMLGATKMRTRDALAAGGMQIILEGLANPRLLQILSQQGLKLNAAEIVNLVTDFIGLPNKSLYIPMSPEEQQSLRQPTPDQMLRMQMQQERLVAQGHHQEASDETEMLMNIVKTITDMAKARLDSETKVKVASAKGRAGEKED